MRISEKTEVKTNLAFMAFMMSSVVGAVVYFKDFEERMGNATYRAQETADSAMLNAEVANKAVLDLSVAVRMSDIKREIKDMQSELRELMRLREDNPRSVLVRDQIDIVEADIREMERLLDCYRTSVAPERCEE